MSTTNILNNVFANIRLSESIDLSKDIIFNNKNYIDRHLSDTPIVKVLPSWNTVDYNEYYALNKSFKFGEKQSLIYFINEIMKESQRLDHDIKMIIDGLYVELILFTHDFNDVTDIDLKFSKIIDEIFDDLSYLKEV